MIALAALDRSESDSLIRSRYRSYRTASILYGSLALLLLGTARHIWGDLEEASIVARLIFRDVPLIVAVVSQAIAIWSHIMTFSRPPVEGGSSDSHARAAEWDSSGTQLCIHYDGNTHAPGSTIIP